MYCQSLLFICWSTKYCHYVLNLFQSFKEIQQEQNFCVDRGSEAFMAIKELARRFSLSFGLDQMKNREAVAAMHKYVFVIHRRDF